MRELPQHPHVLVTHTDAPHLLVWNTDSQPDCSAVKVRPTPAWLPAAEPAAECSVRAALISTSEPPSLFLLPIPPARPLVCAPQSTSVKQQSVPDLVLVGHTEPAEFALSLSSAAPLVASGGRDTNVSRCAPPPAALLPCCLLHTRAAALHPLAASPAHSP